MEDDDLHRWWMTEVDRLSERPTDPAGPSEQPPGSAGPAGQPPGSAGPSEQPPGSVGPAGQPPGSVGSAGQPPGSAGPAGPGTDDGRDAASSPSTGGQMVATAVSLVPMALPDRDRGLLGRWGVERLGRTLLLGVALGFSFGAGLVLADRVPFTTAAEGPAAAAPQVIDSSLGSAPAGVSEPSSPAPASPAADDGLVVESDAEPQSQPQSQSRSRSESEAAEPSESESVSTSSTASPREVVSSVEPTQENPTGAVRYAIYRDGTAYLRGMARDAEAVGRLEATFGEVFGADNIVSEYEISEDAPRWTDAPIYFENVVLFDLGSSELRPEFLGLLEQVAQLIDQGPFVSIAVVGRTDASGSASFNQQLAEDRAWAVVDYYVDELGVPEHRIKPEIVGEQDANPLANEAMAALERRVELRVSGLRG